MNAEPAAIVEVPPTVSSVRPDVAMAQPIAAAAQRTSENQEPAAGVNGVAGRSQTLASADGESLQSSAAPAPAAAKEDNTPAKPTPQNATSTKYAETTDAAQDSTAPATGQAQPVSSGTQKIPQASPTAALASSLQPLTNLAEMSPAAKPAQTQGTDKSAAQNAAPAVTQDKSQATDKNHATNGSSPSAGTQSNQQAGGPAMQHPQANDAASAAAATAKSADGLATPMPVQNAPATHHGEAPSAVRATDAAQNLPQTPAESGETGAAGGINTAKLIQTLSQTEMHVGLRSAEFGDISIRTSLGQQQMVAQISVDHGDLGRAIAAATPGLQARLGHDFGVHALIEVNQSNASFSGERGSGSQEQPQRSFARAGRIDGAANSVEPENAVLRMGSIVDNGYRLDIRA